MARWCRFFVPQKKALIASVMYCLHTMTQRNQDTHTLPLVFDPPSSPARNKGGRPRLTTEPLTTAQRAKRHRDKRKAAPIEEQGTTELLRRLASGLRVIRDKPNGNETSDARATMARIMRELARRHCIEF
jgi:hypothetical protein